ncbi:hypothetical protein OIU84_025419 [Salix udensis]|uniref:Uncharacterized protein n=1 Tax=Salix udensis TaxID=889485 RepID=A0AAD6KLD7_9ROSI|nr:hypothetical protein OIU84_025419 [Salix udensis]
MKNPGESSKTVTAPNLSVSQRYEALMAIDESTEGNGEEGNKEGNVGVNGEEEKERIKARAAEDEVNKRDKGRRLGPRKTRAFKDPGERKVGRSVGGDGPSGEQAKQWAEIHKPKVKIASLMPNQITINKGKEKCRKGIQVDIR